MVSASDPVVLVAGYRPLPGPSIVAQVREQRFKDPNWLYIQANSPDLWQGDLIPNVELAWIDSTGNVVVYEGAGLVLSHGCDTLPDRDLVATIAPAFELDTYLKMVETLEPHCDLNARRAAITENRLTNVFFLPGVPGQPDRCVDFSWAAAVSTKRLDELVARDGLVGRLRLSDMGWYLFTAKLAHHVARLEHATDYPRT